MHIWGAKTALIYEFHHGSDINSFPGKEEGKKHESIAFYSHTRRMSLTYVMSKISTSRSNTSSRFFVEHLATMKVTIYNSL